MCALTAGPGVTNGMSAMGTALQNGSPVVVLGGRAPQMRWGQGSLQEIDHVPFVAPLARSARTAGSTAEIPGLMDEAFAAALGPPGGPAFLDFPLDYAFMEAAVDADARAAPADPLAEPVAEGVERAIELLRAGERPVVMAGTGLYWAHAEHALLYGYSVAADLQEECRYDLVVSALGGHGELVRRPPELRPALERAFASGLPALVNVMTDPSVAYPRKSNLA